MENESRPGRERRARARTPPLKRGELLVGPMRRSRRFPRAKRSQSALRVNATGGGAAKPYVVRRSEKTGPRSLKLGSKIFLRRQQVGASGDGSRPTKLDEDRDRTPVGSSAPVAAARQKGAADVARRPPQCPGYRSQRREPPSQPTPLADAEDGRVAGPTRRGQQVGVQSRRSPAVLPARRERTGHGKWALMYQSRYGRRRSTSDAKVEERQGASAAEGAEPGRTAQERLGNWPCKADDVERAGGRAPARSLPRSPVMHTPVVTLTQPRRQQRCRTRSAHVA